MPDLTGVGLSEKTGTGTGITRHRFASVADMKAFDITQLSVGNRVELDSYWPNLNKGGGDLIVVDTAIAGDDGHYFKPDVADGNKTYVRVGMSPFKVNIIDFGCYPCNGTVISAATQDTARQRAADSLATALARGTQPSGWTAGSNGFGAEYICPSEKSLNGTEKAMYPVTATTRLPTFFGIRVHGGGIFNRQTVNIPVFDFLPSDSGYPNNTLRQCVIEHLHFTEEGNASTSGGYILFRKNTVAASTTNNVTIRNCSCERGFRFIDTESGGFAQHVYVYEVNFQNMRGALIALEGAGNVCPKVHDCWVQATALTEAAIILRSCFNPQISHISFEAVSGSTANPPEIRIFDSNNAKISHIRYEWGQPDDDFQFIRCENAANSTIIEDVNFQNVEFLASRSSIFALAVGGICTLRGQFNYQGCTFGAGSEVALAGGFSPGLTYWATSAWSNEYNNSGTSTLKITSTRPSFDNVTVGNPPGPPT